MLERNMPSVVATADAAVSHAFALQAFNNFQTTSNTLTMLDDASASASATVQDELLLQQQQLNFINGTAITTPSLITDMAYDVWNVLCNQSLLYYCGDNGLIGGGNGSIGGDVAAGIGPSSGGIGGVSGTVIISTSGATIDMADVNNNNSNKISDYYYDNTTAIAGDISFILPWWRQVLWNILFGVMVIVATGGNLIVIWIVLTTKRMRTVTNYFIVNLSIADAMVSSLNVTFNYIYMLYNDWPFGQIYCKISQFIATLSISASVFTLMAISIDRYVAIMKPLQPRMSKRSNLAIAAAIWISSVIISCPMLLFFTTGVINTADGLRTVCYTEWPDGSTNHSQLEYIYNILFMILTYILPIISMTLTYSRVGIELWGSKAIGEYTPRQVENVKSKRRVVKMMIVVVLIFAVCWLPFHAYFIVTSCYPTITEMPFIQELYLMIYWLAMSNSMYNPIIYCWMNSRFRFGFKMFFRWCPFVHIGAETLNRRDNMTSRYSCSGSPDHNRIKRNGIDTQRSFLYTCPGSPKNHRISHCGIGRSSTVISHRDTMRHSMPIGGGGGGGRSSGGSGSGSNSYYQRCSIGNAHSVLIDGTGIGVGVGVGGSGSSSSGMHELAPLCSNSEGSHLNMAVPRGSALQLRQKWATNASSTTSNPLMGATTCIDMSSMGTGKEFSAAAVAAAAGGGCVIDDRNAMSKQAVTAAAFMS